ncbi:MAG: RNase adapter RapZ [Gammaproteobacteria bacterium]|nr:RNase adapter RapZ [Gammaproteobacteria bacterium]
MKLIVISGRSGSGKSTCLHVLEDMGYYCVDNLPASMLGTLAERISNNIATDIQDVAVSIDARNMLDDLTKFPDIFESLDARHIDRQIIFLDADDNTLLKRFSETRRKHPLTGKYIGLIEAIKKERELLAPIITLANLTIDTSSLSLHQLRDSIKTRVAPHEDDTMAVQFQSFGYKNGVPVDADIVFDVRCLPNPYWIAQLRGLTGLEQGVIDYLDSQQEVQEMFNDINGFLETWLPRFEANNRSYISIAIGCTGGQHRSVYLCERLKSHFNRDRIHIQVRHKDIN